MVDELKKFKMPVYARQLDVRDGPTCSLRSTRLRGIGPVDILVNNAGMAVVKRALDADEKSWDTVIETNLNSVFLLSRIAARSMVKLGRGKILNLASEYAILARR